MELQIAATILGFGAMFVLGMYVATQIEKDINNRISKKKADKYFENRNKGLEEAVEEYYEVEMAVPEGKEFNKPYPLKDLRSDDEKRMDIIGQNGNDGLHYEDEDKYKDYPRTGGLSPDTGPRN